ncbi:hypothetical protein COX93_00935 [Candidatus Nomurabacteria bacterium CG_4_10_14_0_2_um_filter_30_12]|uniref:Uncharacterized protein n=2 Tax=Candidatus Nomuraibacteriota TaxID=1752729 RepID=A0A1J4V0Z3_9BACT|nr:MAG: hypothetical protein AUJ22_01045 [Candidatus Nomurabacteria bacterium CG1_02_31_12]PIZ87490.1 MAG: hypothetical protein COX93_00935 [Candidatus Nomurabacteria bacterium CG_4_10_14_0_2_um_filter_30_12]
MDPESKELIQDTLKLTEENNELLHKIRGVQKRETLWQVAKMILIIGITLGSFYYIEPYLNKMMDLYNSITGIQQDVKNVSDGTSSFKDLLKKF